MFFFFGRSHSEDRICLDRRFRLKLAGQWLAEIDRSASIDALNHSGFAFASSSIDFVLGPQVVKW